MPLAPGFLFGSYGSGARQQYVVSPDGQRFLLSTTSEVTSPITVILNWKAKP